MALALSTKPWSDYTEADYTLEQWHAACLIHQHTGPPTSKNQCKLPVKTPAGALNRDGCIAAAGALAGARSPLQASSEEKTAAAKALIRYYGQFNMKPTPKMLELAHSDEFSDILAHYGVKGMRWGFRKSEPGTVSVSTKTTPVQTIIRTKGGARLPAHPDAIAARVIGQKLKRSGKNSLSNEELQQYALRLNLERQVSQINATTGNNSGAKFVTEALRDVGKVQIRQVANEAVSRRIRKLLFKAAVA